METRMAEAGPTEATPTEGLTTPTRISMRVLMRITMRINYG